MIARPPRPAAASSVEPSFGFLDGMNVILQRDLLRQMGKAYHGQPAPMGQRPGANSSIVLAVAQTAAMMIQKNAR
jgi:hypothetical protein